jgi:hypothetical protein
MPDPTNPVLPNFKSLNVFSPVLTVTSVIAAQLVGVDGIGDVTRVPAEQSSDLVDDLAVAIGRDIAEMDMTVPDASAVGGVRTFKILVIET